MHLIITARLQVCREVSVTIMSDSTRLGLRVMVFNLADASSVLTLFYLLLGLVTKAWVIQFQKPETCF